MIHSLPSSEPLTAQKLFSKLYVSYYARLVRFASLYVGAMGDAENIVQDFFLYLWERKEILPELQQPDAYLFSAVKHRCLNFLRSQLSIHLQVQINLNNICTHFLSSLYGTKKHIFRLFFPKIT
jgi:RNA polymerase sigma-70 factor (ECF subfamily)